MVNDQVGEDGRREGGHRGDDAVGGVADAGEVARHADRAADRGPVRVPRERRAEEDTGTQRPAPRKGAKATQEAEGVLVSGSFEYKSDDSLAAFKKHLEANYPVECVAGVRASPTRTRRSRGWRTSKSATSRSSSRGGLQIDGESLDAVKKYVKSGKPIVGIRTASHGFQKWLEMDKEVWAGTIRGTSARRWSPR